MRAVAYCRVSTTDQGDQGVSLAMQRERMDAWCVANGFELAAMFCEVMSGGRAANRPEVLKAINLACKLRGTLVVYSLSRLARSVKDTLNIAERLEKAGANLASLTERIDTNSALGKMVFRLLSTLNEFEKDQLAERTEGAMAHLRRSNRRISARIPMGYDLATDGQTLIPNAVEQSVIIRICDHYRSGSGFTAIARQLASDRVPTKSGGRWHPSTVKAIVRRQHKMAT